MGPSKLFYPHILLLLHLASLTMAQPDFLFYWCSDTSGNYTDHSIYQKNLKNLFDTLNSLASDDREYNGFYSRYIGKTPNIVNAIALCRGDVAQHDCRGCINNSTQRILQACPEQKEATAYYDICTLRFSNQPLFYVVTDDDDHLTFYMWNTTNVTSDLNEFNQGLQTLMVRLRTTAASGDSLRKFATGNQTAGLWKLFGLTQCTPDLSQQQCDDCLFQATGEIPIYIAGKVGGRVIKASCNLRFEIYPFYSATPDVTNSSPPPPQLSPPPTATIEGKKSTRTIIIIVVPIVVVLLLIICISAIVRLRKPKEMCEAIDEIKGVESLQFNFETIRAATNSFSDQNRLGRGGFGAVYKGTLPDGQEIAVKRLSRNSAQGDTEFKNEVLLVAKLQHRNLVKLLGFCLERNERLLIYEFLPNTSLDHFLFDPIKCVQLDWERRCKIIGGIARGILYLHEDSRLRIVHRDLKASNILLDADMNPKIADFGMARLFAMDETQGDTSKIVGTYGYMAPEYAMHGQFSIKSDVFSFGVLILEIVTGKKNRCFRNGENIEDLLSYVWRNWTEGTAHNLVDPTLKAGSTIEMMRCMHIGLLCVQEHVASRPSMASVLHMINNQSLSLQIPSQPAYFMQNSTESDMAALLEDSSRAAESRNEASITDLEPR